MWTYGPGWMMGGGAGFGFFGMILWLFLLIVIIAAGVWIVRSFIPKGASHPTVRSSPGLHVLEERYARGEINRDEYLEKKRDLG